MVQPSNVYKEDRLHETATDQKAPQQRTRYIHRFKRSITPLGS